MQVFNYVDGRLNQIQDSGIYRSIYLLRLSAGLKECMILKISSCIIFNGVHLSRILDFVMEYFRRFILYVMSIKRKRIGEQS
jgi:hypothetical protein